MKLRTYSLAAIERRYKVEKNVKVKLRLQMMMYLREGYTHRKVSEMLRVSVGIVAYWKKRFEEEGFDGLGDREGRGRKPQFTDEELSMLGGLIDSGLLMDDGYTRGLKTKDVAEFFNDYFGINYTKRHCRRILKGISCSLKVPRPRSKRRNQQAVDAFKREFKKNERVWMMT